MLRRDQILNALVSEPSSRPAFRSTLSQPSQMGNFKHQSLRSGDRDRDKERDSERERERDIRDREGQERLRHVSSLLSNFTTMASLMRPIAF